MLYRYRKSSNPNGEANQNALKFSTPEAKQYKRKKQQVMNLFRAFLLTNILLTIFGIIILFEEALQLQVV